MFIKQIKQLNTSWIIYECFHLYMLFDEDNEILNQISSLVSLIIIYVCPLIQNMIITLTIICLPINNTIYWWFVTKSVDLNDISVCISTGQICHRDDTSFYWSLYLSKYNRTVHCPVDSYTIKLCCVHSKIFQLMFSDSS